MANKVVGTDIQTRRLTPEYGIAPFVLARQFFSDHIILKFNRCYHRRTDVHYKVT